MSTAQMENSHRKRPGQGWRLLLLAGAFYDRQENRKIAYLLLHDNSEYAIL